LKEIFVNAKAGEVEVDQAKVSGDTKRRVWIRLGTFANGTERFGAAKRPKYYPKRPPSFPGLDVSEFNETVRRLTIEA
jgi:hypothetical protein